MRRTAFETSGSLIARPVSLVAAGNVNSGQRAIWGSGPISASCSGGLTPIATSKRPAVWAGCARAWGRGSEALPSYGGRHLFGVCGLLATLPTVSRRSGAGPGG